MTDTSYDPADGVSFAVRLLNSWDELEPEPELLVDASVVQRFLTRHGLEDAAAVAGDADLEWLRELRGRLARAWDAADDARAVEQLNAILAEANAQPWLSNQGGPPRFRYDRAGLPIRAFADAFAARALLDEIARGGWARFGRCEARPCRCVFIDRTRSKVRRYCGRLCADRAAHQAFRRRRAVAD